MHRLRFHSHSERSGYPALLRFCDAFALLCSGYPSPQVSEATPWVPRAKRGYPERRLHWVPRALAMRMKAQAVKPLLRWVPQPSPNGTAGLGTPGEGYPKPQANQHSKQRYQTKERHAHISSAQGLLGTQTLSPKAKATPSALHPFANDDSVRDIVTSTSTSTSTMLDSVRRALAPTISASA